MIKKNILIIFLIFILTNCGFTPVYLNNNDINFSIEQVDYIGEKEFNNFLKIHLNQYKKKDVNNKLFIEASSIYNKNVLTKNVAGEVTNYELQVEVTFIIKPTNKKIKLSEKKIIESLNDKFEETRQERSIKQSFAYSISNKLKSELINDL
tara:strand:+ start:208 stop:660 length:453 start_codon:yes stop_codon:yes gene_type:complete